MTDTVPDWVADADEVGGSTESYGTWPNRDTGEEWPDRWSSGGKPGDWVAGTVKLYVPSMRSKFSEEGNPVVILTDCTGLRDGAAVTGDLQVVGTNKALRAGLEEAEPRPGDRLYFIFEALVETANGNPFKRYRVKHDPSTRTASGNGSTAPQPPAWTEDEEPF